MNSITASSSQVGYDLEAGCDTIRTTVPARLDRLPWSRFHMLVVVALGITWILDGLEVTIVGSIGPMLQQHRTLSLTPSDVGSAASIYVVGAVVGALVFGWLTDKVGRKAIFSLTLGVYILGALLSACSWNFLSFAIFRFIIGLGIGGEYSAINSAIDELIPARLRGRVDLIVNGSFWIGAALGAVGSIFLINGHLIPVWLGWRLGLGIGGVLGLIVILLRRWVPESPRWLCTHGKHVEGERVTDEIEQRVYHHTGEPLDPCHETMVVHTRDRFGFRLVLRAMFGTYRVRSVLVMVMITSQAFLYNAVFFTYGMVLTQYEGVADTRVGLFILPLALGNFLGPLLLGRFFDTIGRRKMIFATYSISGVLMIAVGWLFSAGLLTAATQTLAWVVIFFFASAAASSAYLTASEVFPLETRALAIALFYAAGNIIGAGAPWLFGKLIESGGRTPLALGYSGAAVLMLITAVVALKIGVDAEGKSLESIAPPLSSH